MGTAKRGRLAAMATAVAAVLGAQAVAQVVGAAPASAAVPGYEIVVASSVNDSATYKSVRANCPTGKQVIGTGFRLGGAPGNIVLDDLIPSATSVLVGAGEDQDGTSANWQVTAYAVCANPLAGLTIVSATSAFAPGASRGATATCPTGRQVVGTGVALSNGFGHITVSYVTYLTTGVSVSAEDDQDGYAGSWSVTAYAVCANPLPGQTYVAASSLGNADQKIVTANCPAGRRATGQSWAHGGGGQTHITFAGIGQGGVTQIVNEDDDGFASSWTAATGVLCATA